MTMGRIALQASLALPFGSETRNGEIAVDVPLPEEPTEMSGEKGQGWITEEAFFTVSPGARQVRQRKEVKMNQLSPAEKREFLKSMELEWQTLLKNQAATVLSLEETAQARARWPDRAMDTRWARTWKPDESKPSGRRAKARLIIKFFTDPNLLDIESPSPTLTREGFMTVLQSVCSHGHKLQLGDVQQAENTGNRSRENYHSSSECRPFKFQVNLVKFGCSCSGRLMDWPMVRGNGGTVSLLQEYSARESRPDSAKSFQQGPGVRHTRNQQRSKTGQGSHRSRTACLQGSCGSSLFCVLRGCQWWEHTC